MGPAAWSVEREVESKPAGEEAAVQDGEVAIDVADRGRRVGGIEHQIAFAGRDRDIFDQDVGFAVGGQSLDEQGDVGRGRAVVGKNIEIPGLPQRCHGQHQIGADRAGGLVYHDQRALSIWLEPVPATSIVGSLDHRKVFAELKLDGIVGRWIERRAGDHIGILR